MSVPRPQPNYTYRATVDRVVDADTVDLVVDYGDRLYALRRIRLDGIDAYEKATEKGKKAVQIVTAMLPIGSLVTVTTRKPDKYGRQLGVVVLPDGRDVAAELVTMGFAVAYDGGKKSL